MLKNRELTAISTPFIPPKPEINPFTDSRIFSKPLVIPIKNLSSNKS